MGTEKTECVPAVYVRGKKKGKYVGGGRHGCTRAREELIKRDGPCPPDKDLCRHTCDNDSMAPNGFVCIEHTVWGTRKENLDDRSEEKRKICGKNACSVERTCPHCGRTIKGPSYFQHHGDRCKHKQAPTSVL